MALITRLSRLFSADVHAVLDRIEEPAIVLKQAIRDMHTAVAAAEQRIQALEARQQQIQDGRASAEHRLHDTSEELDVCLDAGNDQLARAVIQRKLELERQLAAASAEATRLAQAVDQQRGALERQRAELDTLRRRAESFDPGAAPCCPPQSPPITPAEVEVALLREKQRRARA